MTDKPKLSRDLDTLRRVLSKSDAEIDAQFANQPSGVTLPSKGKPSMQDFVRAAVQEAIDESDVETAVDKIIGAMPEEDYPQSTSPAGGHLAAIMRVREAVDALPKDAIRDELLWEIDQALSSSPTVSSNEDVDMLRGIATIISRERPAAAARLNRIATTLEASPTVVGGEVERFMAAIEAEPDNAHEGLVFSYGQVERGIQAVLAALSEEEG